MKSAGVKPVYNVAYLHMDSIIYVPSQDINIIRNNDRDVWLQEITPIRLMLDGLVASGVTYHTPREEDGPKLMW